MEKYYITTAIDYTNDVVHIGHMFQKIVADVLARFHRIKLGEENVFFLTGTDEHGQNIAKAAEKNRVTPKAWTDTVADQDKKQHQALTISYNRFIRTTDEDHREVAQEVWRRTEANGDIYLGKYTGLYCSSCEAYYIKGDLVEGKCPFHPTLTIRKITEKNYFFRWSKYEKFLIDHIEQNQDFVKPEGQKHEMLGFAKRGIQDIPISRTSFSWGIPIPEHPGHVQYVWYDALTNYLTGIGFLKNPELFNKFWPADVHLLGRDNVRWHALLWPAMLKSAGLALPKTIYGHGFLTLNGRKISKTLGNVVQPTDWVKKYGSDAVRYYLLRYTTLEEDGDISEEKLMQAYNADLANGLGNLVARIAKLCEKNRISGSPHDDFTFDPTIDGCIINYKLNEALRRIWEEISSLDREINEKNPWLLSGKQAEGELNYLIGKIQRIAFWLEPFMPHTAKNIRRVFSGSPVSLDEQLFPRIA